MHRSHRPVIGLTAVALAAAAGLTACSSTKSGGGTTDAASSACGTVPTKLPQDPDGVLAALPSQYQSLYNGYSTPVYKSSWANWKPTKTSGYTVGISLSETNNGYQIALESLLEADLKAAGYTVDLSVSSDEVTDQIADFNQMVEQHVDLIVYEPLSGSAFASAVDSAQAAGIPSISILNAVDDKNTISLVPNAWDQGAQMAAYIAKQIGGSGKVLDVHGISGVSIDTDTFAGAKAAFAECSGISTDDSLADQFADSTAKTDVETYLETHPQKIAAAITSGAGATGVLEGFQAAGRGVPIIANDSLEEGEMAYWNTNKASYKGVGITSPPNAVAQDTTTVIKDLFAGDGIKLSAIMLDAPLVTDDNLAQWMQPGWTESTAGNAGGPAGFTMLPSALLNAVLTNPTGS
jgi:ABC-type sugar transport system substrate-binding protein